MNGNEKYQQSIAAEFAAQKDRVRFFIENAHWGEDGRYKEIILADYIKSVVPSNVSVGTGFIKNAQDEVTSQIDIIIYKNDYPYLFKKGDFVILIPDSVLGIIEVKSNAATSILSKKQSNKPSTIEKCEHNGKIIGSKSIFNGIFGYDSELRFENMSRRSHFFQQLEKSEGYLNCIAFNSNFFCKYWNDGNPHDRCFDPRPCYSFYNLSAKELNIESCSHNEGLAYGYFISNLLESVYEQTHQERPSDQYYEFLYPIEEGKETHRIKGMDIKQGGLNGDNVQINIRGESR